MTNLIVNGSFEDTTGLSPTSYGHTGSPTGWTDANGVPVEVVRSGHVGQDASDGTYWIDSGEVGRNLDISQTVAGVVDGQTYELSYDLSEWSASGGNQLNVYWNGVLIQTYDGNGDNLNVFDSFTHTVVGQAGPNVLRFEEVGSLDNAGIVIDNVSLVQSPVPCFVAGTRIRTPDGDRPVEKIAAGDLVLTYDHGPQPVLWAGYRTLGPAALAAAPHLRPIRIRAGAASNPVDLLVSPQHRLLTRHPHHLEPGQVEALISAKQLAAFRGGPIRVARGKRMVRYHHLLLADHQILWANGALAESLLAGEWMLRGAESPAAGFLDHLPDPTRPMAPCRPLVRSAWLRRQSAAEAVEAPRRRRLHRHAA